MHYVIADIHNESRKLCKLLENIHFGANDHLCLLGDLFDRGGAAADPVEIYFSVLALGDRCTVVRGNHDQWLGDYIDRYLLLSEKERLRCDPYQYNSFDLIRKRLTLVDLQELSLRIKHWPLQVELKIGQASYLFAHAQATLPSKREADNYYLLGNGGMERFIRGGIRGYITFCGHTSTSDFEGMCAGQYLDEAYSSVWCNEAKNVYMLDCGCGYTSGRLACFCVETGERWYV